jgi:hypothetical protein
LEDKLPTQVPALRENTALLPSKPRPKLAKIMDEDEPPFWDEITIRAGEGGGRSASRRVPDFAPA